MSDVLMEARICATCCEHQATLRAYSNRANELLGKSEPCCELCAPWDKSRWLPLLTRDQERAALAAAAKGEGST